MVFADANLRRRVLFTVAALVVFRLLSTIPIPGIDAFKLQNFFAGNQFLGLLNIFSGGGLANLSIVMLGVGPYITSSIIMQLLTMMSPRLKTLYQEEGEAGRAKFNMYTRWLAIPLAIIQAFGFLVLLRGEGIVPALSTFDLARNILVVASGSMLLVWVGELISEFGIGNGVSLIIFAGIVARIPVTVGNEYAKLAGNTGNIPVYAAFLVAAVLVVWAVVAITEAERPIPITYAKRVRGMKVYGGTSTYLPLRINQAGVIPIVFALSILLFPQMIFKFLSQLNNVVVSKISDFVLGVLANPWLYSAFYFILVFLFTYFYTAVTFDPEQISTNLQKNGAFIPGVRPGKSTSAYIYKILTRLTLVGATFLGLIAVLPLAMRAVTDDTSLAIGGTALLIVVSVVIDLMKKIDAQISMREY